jgi:hypothetical protein
VALGQFQTSLLDLGRTHYNDSSNSVRITGGEVGITTPLMEAIRAQLPENIKILLEAGADPNGIPTEAMSRYATFFLRFRPSIPRFVDDGGDVASREVLLECMDLPQMSGLTLEEVEDRFWDGMAPFWCEEDFIKADFYPHGEAAPSLVEAARCGSIEIFDHIWAAGADASFWMAPQFKLPSQDDHNFIQEQDDIRPQFVVPEPPTPSSLSISTPVHAALQNRDVEMLKHLLTAGFDPNTMPLANPTRCFTPLMGTIIHHSTFSRSEFDILISHPSININLRTPIYGVHILHFAVAVLDLDMLKYVAVHTPLKNAGVTALGNTLLHIACMPSDALAVQRHAEIIYDSIHETRDLHASNDPYASCPPDLNFYPVTDEKELQRQTAVVKYLWENGITDVERRDVHGNTALHYLAGCRDFNDELMNWWIEQQGVEKVWRESSNEYGASPEELYYAGQIAKRDRVRGYMPWFDRSRWTDARKRRKEEIWNGLLREKKRQILETGSMHE